MYNPATKNRTRISHPEPVYAVYGSNNCVFTSQFFRYEYSSLITPRCTIDYDLVSGEKKVLKQLEVPNYDPSLYTCRRVEATAHDGAKIPISIVYK